MGFQKRVGKNNLVYHLYFKDYINSLISKYKWNKEITKKTPWSSNKEHPSFWPLASDGDERIRQKHLNNFSSLH